MILGALIAVGLSGCDQEVSETCSGTLIEVPEGGDEDYKDNFLIKFSISDL